MQSFRSAALVGIALIAVLPALAQHNAAQAIFEGRDVAIPADRSAFFNMVTPSDRILHPDAGVRRGSATYKAVIQRFAQVKPGKSLLINDCGPFCDDEFFTFGRIMERAAHSTGVPNAKCAAGAWYAMLQRLDPVFTMHVKPWTGSYTDQFQLLAVVNRLDLATPGRSGKWSGAELRFVYGAISPTQQALPEPFSAIVEFQLPDLSWKDLRLLAEAWDDLRRAGTPETFAVRLKCLLRKPWSPVAKVRASMSPHVRIRTNSETGNNGPWIFAQWEMSKGSFSQTKLQDEIRRECSQQVSKLRVFTETGCPLMTQDSCSAYLPLFQALRQRRTLEVKHPELLAQTQCYAALGFGMDGPAGACASDPETAQTGSLGRARNVLALQQCSNCHGPETQNADFFHVSNRMAGESMAKLSPFLTGLDPSLPAAVPGEAGSIPVFLAGVDLTWPGGGGCKAKTVHIQRYYNDLARRSLYLAAVLTGRPYAPPSRQLMRIIRSYMTDMTH